VERAIGGFGSLTRQHISVAVPEFTAVVIGEIFVDGWNAGAPHFETVFVTEQKPALPEVFVVGIDPAADVTVVIGPRAGLDVDARSYKTQRRAALVGLDEGALRFLVEDRLARQLTKCAELKEQRSGF